MIQDKPKIDKMATKLVIDGTEVTEPNKLASTFNDYLANIGSSLASKISQVNRSPSDYLVTSTSDSFYLIPTTPAEIGYFDLEVK